MLNRESNRPSNREKTTAQGFALAALIVAGAGAIQFAWFFHDPSPGQGIGSHLLGFAMVCFLAGVPLGLATRRWPLWCIGAAWGSVLVMAILLAMHEVVPGLLVVATSALASLAGGALGTALRHRTHFSLG